MHHLSQYVVIYTIVFLTDAKQAKHKGKTVGEAMTGKQLWTRWQETSKTVRNELNVAWEFVLKQNFNNKPPSGQQWETLLQQVR